MTPTGRDPYRDEVSSLERRLDELKSEATQIEERLGDRKRFGPLENLRIASPCDVSWHAMVGDDRVRFCGGCKKNVYNFAGMTRDEAYALLRSTNGRACVRLYKRADGTVLTSDCGVGSMKKNVVRLAVVAAGGAALFAAAFVGGGMFMMGDVAPPDHDQPPVPTSAEPAPSAAPPTPARSAAAESPDSPRPPAPTDRRPPR